MSTLSMLAEKLWWPESASKIVSFTCMTASFFSSLIVEDHMTLWAG